MKSSFIYKCAAAAAILAVISANANAAKRAPRIDPNAEQVEFFDAMKKGVIGVQFIPKDAKQANIIIKNNGLS